MKRKKDGDEKGSYYQRGSAPAAAAGVTIYAKKESAPSIEKGTGYLSTFLLKEQKDIFRR